METKPHLFKYDRTSESSPSTFRGTKGGILMATIASKCSATDPSELPWADLGVDLVVESTGIFTAREKADLHLDAGARSRRRHPPRAKMASSMGVNETEYDPGRH